MLSLTELGLKLQQARQEKNISLDELQEVTKIQKRYLEAIENGEYEKLPGQFYARAFIKTYAEAVGLNPDELFESFPSDTPKSAEPVTETLQRPQKTSSKLTDSTKFSSYFSKAVLVIAAIFVIAIVWFLLQSGGNTEKPEATESGESSVKVEKGNTNPEKDSLVVEEEKNEKTKKDITKKVKEDKKKETSALTITEQSSTELTIETPEKINVDISFSAETWMDVKNGLGKTFVAKMFNEQDVFQEDLSSEDEIRIKFGYVPAAKLKINGEEVVLPKEGGLYKVIIQKKSIENTTTNNDET